MALIKLKSAIVGTLISIYPILLGCVETELTCVGLIEEFDSLPSELEFQGCEPSNESQLRALRATYQIRGRDSLEIEQYLIENYGMTPLKFVCCGWESVSSEGRRHGTYRDRSGNYYELRMYSGEVKIPEQLRREDVPYFYVEVVGFLEEP